MLQALEIAPNFEAALDLLLKVQPPPTSMPKERFSS